MLTPSSVKLIEPSIATYKVGTTNELPQHFNACSESKFTGRLDWNIQGIQIPQWSLFFQQGHLIWGASEMHPIRRWSRLLFQHYPQLAVGSVSQGADRPQYWDYDSLATLVQKGKIEHRQLAAFVADTLTEIVFDIINQGQPGNNRVKMQVTYRRLPQDVIDSALVVIQADQVWQQAKQALNIWEQAGLTGFSPNLAPTILDADELRRQSSLLAYHNLTTLADGHWTLRDLAVRLKQPLVSLTQSIKPYVHQGVMGLVEVEDLSYSVKSVAVGPLVAYIEDSLFDSAAMSQILAQAGCRFINIRDSIQAMPMLLQHKPDLIFLDLLMPVANGYEVCSQIRRVSALKATPVIIVTSCDGIVDRMRAKLVGSSGFIAKPINPEKVMSVLHQYLPASRPLN
jgi:two-component system, chemotaxis family, response regulator PixG